MIRSSEVLPDPLAPVTASASPDGNLEIEPGKHLPAASHASDAASREPHFALSKPSGILWVAQQNLWVMHCCGAMVDVAAPLERF